MPIPHRGPPRRIRAPLVLVVLAAACNDELPTPPSRSASGSSVELPGGPASVTIAEDVRLLNAALARDDSASIPIRAGSLRMVGEKGDTVALTLNADDHVLQSAGSDVRLRVRSGDENQELVLRRLVTGVTVFRFAKNDRVTLDVILTRSVRSVAAGTFRLTLHTNATIDSVYAPWAQAASSSASFAAGPPDPGSTSCDLNAKTGACGNSSWNIEPYVPAAAFPGFQSDFGTGASREIVVLFSAAVANVTTTIYDPTWSGNSMTAYNGTSFVGTKDFAYSSQPGVNLPDTKQISGSGVGGITKLVLTPADSDYVTYEVTIQAGADTLIVACGPPTSSTGGAVLRGAQVKCTARASSNGTFDVLYAQIDSPTGIGFIAVDGTATNRGKGWESTTGPALYSASVRIVATGKGGAIGGMSGTGQIQVTARSPFLIPTFPSRPANFDYGGPSAGFLSVYVPVFENVFKLGSFDWDPDGAMLGTVPIISATSGPFARSQLSIIGDVAQLPLSVPIVKVHPLFSRDTSITLYSDQDGTDDGVRTANNQGVPFCNNAVSEQWVTSLLEHVKRHEGFGGAGNSHYDIYVDQFATAKPMERFESMTFPANTTPDDVKRLLMDAIKAWQYSDPIKARHTLFDREDATVSVLQQAAGCALDLDITKEINRVPR